MDLKIGMTNEIKKKVTEDLLASHVGSGLVDVFATPMMIASMEESSAGLVAPFLEEGKTTVGIEISTTHSAATPLGMEVRVISEVTDIAPNGKVITFKVTAFDEKDKIGEGTHKRCIVDKKKFEERTLAKLDK